MKFPLQFVPRNQITRGKSFLILVLSVVSGLLFLSLLLAFNGKDPVYALSKIFTASFGSLFGLQETVTKAIPLVLIGSGLTVAYRAKFWNIGAESQMLAGAMASCAFALWLGPDVPSWIVIPILFFSGFVAGGLWGTVAAVLKVRFHINEVISTLMLNYILFEFLRFLVVGPWKGKTQHGYPYTDDLGANAVLGMIPGTRIPYISLILAVVAVSALFYFVYRTKLGYEIRVIGENPQAARYAGISFFRTTVVMMFLSGAMAGLAGVSELSANLHHVTFPESVTSGYGFTAIIVAWLAKLNPLLTLVSAFFFAGILVGGDAIQISLGLPAATVQVFNGVLLFFLIVSEFFAQNRLLWKEKSNG